ncbi:MAG: mechanosensitive ion channel domain-containing protein [Candidatus Omnitrophota bacterium]
MIFMKIKYLSRVLAAGLLFYFMAGICAGGTFARAADEEAVEAERPAETADSAARREADSVKNEVKAAKQEADLAQEEAEKAKLEADIQTRQAEVERKKFETEVKETEAVKKEAEIVQKTVKDKAEIKKAVQKTKQEEMEDKIARENAELMEKKMEVARERSDLAEERLKIAQAKLSMAMETIKLKEEKKGLLYKITKTGGIVFAGLMVFFILRILVKKLINAMTKKEVLRESEATLRIKTVIKLFDWLGVVLIIVSVVYLVLQNHGLDVAPLLAGAGIVGLAFGFGGQYLIRDLINGLFILIEGQFFINDVVKIGEYGGLVEDINLRITRLRDLEGRVIIIPNGEIKTVVNYTKDYAHALLDIGVAYKENVDQVMGVIREISVELRKHPYFGRLILEDLEMLGVDAFDDSAVVIKFRVKTLPIKQWEVMREFRRRIKNRFDELGIEIPFPHRTLYWGEQKKDNNIPQK